MQANVKIYHCAPIALLFLASLPCALSVERISRHKVSSKYNAKISPPRSNDKLSFGIDPQIEEGLANTTRFSVNYLNKTLESEIDNRNGENGETELDERVNSTQMRWPSRVIGCVRKLDMSKCLKIFYLQRLQGIILQMRSETLGKNMSLDFDVADELERNFMWENFVKTPTSLMDSLILKGTNEVLKQRVVRLKMFPGVLVELDVNDKTGLLGINIMKDNETTEIAEGRKRKTKRKKMQKNFYNMIPYLIVPPLIMSGILPFILPILKMMVMKVVMLNNMALSGTIFTLLRNNAFDDSYKKVVYANEGYHNEHKTPTYIQDGSYFGNGFVSNWPKFDDDNSHQVDPLDNTVAKEPDSNESKEVISGPEYSVRDKSSTERKDKIPVGYDIPDADELNYYRRHPYHNPYAENVYKKRLPSQAYKNGFKKYT